MEAIRKASGERATEPARALPRAEVDLPVPSDW